MARGSKIKGNPMKQKTSLRNKITISIVLVILFLGLAVIFVINQVLPEALRKETKLRGISMARNLSGRSLNPILTDNRFELKELVDEEKRLGEDVVYAFIMDAKGNVLAHTFKDGIPIELKTDNLVTPSQISSIQLLKTQEGFIYDIAAPVSAWNEIIGIVRIGMNEENIRKTINETLGMVIVVTILVMLLCIFIGFGLSSLIVKPIRELQRLVQEITEGKLGTKIDVTTNDEIGQLATSFNKMTEELKGSITLIGNLNKEIARRKKLEEIVGQEREKAQIYLDTVDVIIVAIDANQIVALINREGACILGFEKEEIIGKNWFDNFIPRQIRAEVEVVFQKLIAGEAELFKNYENPILTKTGEERTILWHNTILKDGKGAITGTLSSGVDITERIKSEKEIKDSAMRLHTVLEEVGDGIAVSDANGHFEIFNSKMQEITGYTIDEANNSGDFSLLLYHDQNERQKALEGLSRVRKGGYHETETIIQAKDGTNKTLMVSSCLTPYKGQDMFLTVYHDISQRKKAEEEREKILLWQQGVNLLQQSLLAPALLENKLKAITDSIVRLSDVDFCRIWLIQPGDMCEQGCVHAEVNEGPHICLYRDKCLHLLASSGRYTHTDGKVHRRVPFGCYKIGRVASGEEHKFLTNNVQNDPRVHNHEWARELGLVSFAGYQLRIPSGETIGVLALFAKHPILSTEDTMLDGLSSTLALVVQQAVAEKALLQSEKKYRQLYEGSQDGFVRVDMQGHILEFNNRYRDMLGYSGEELYKLTYIDLTPEQWHQMEAEIVQEQILPRGYSEAYQKEYKRKDGTVFPIELMTYLIKDEMNNPIGMWAFVHDIANRKEAEEKIKQAAEKWQRTFDAMSDSVFIQDRELNIIRANKAFFDLFKLKPEDVIGKRCYELVHKLDRPWPTCPVEMSKEDKKPHVEEVDDPNIGIPLLITASPLFNNEGEVIGSVHVAKDISTMKNFEKELKKKIHDLEVFHKVTVDRELKMIELKKEIATLRAQNEGK
jgi:PAS domain S-box-containing protein